VKSYESDEINQKLQQTLHRFNKKQITPLLKTCIATKSSKNVQDRLWYQEFKPCSSEGPFENNHELKDFYDWLWNFQNRGLAEPKDDDEYLPDASETEKESNVIIIQGPPGCEKTATVYAMAELFQFHVIEVYPAITTNRSLQNLMDASLSRSMGKRSTHAMFQKKSKRRKLNTPKAKSDKESHSQSLILLDEIDNMLRQEQGLKMSGLKELFSKTKVPVIMTCNKVPRELENMGLRTFYFKRPTTHDCFERATTMLFQKGKILTPVEVIQLVRVFGCDLRRLAMNLQFWCSGEDFPRADCHESFLLQFINLSECKIACLQKLASTFSLKPSSDINHSLDEFFQHYFSIMGSHFLVTNIFSFIGQIKSPNFPTKSTKAEEKSESPNIDIETRKRRSALTKEVASFLDSLALVEIIETKHDESFKLPREISLICDMACDVFGRNTKMYVDESASTDFSLQYDDFSGVKATSKELQMAFTSSHLPRSNGWFEIQSAIDCICLQQEPLLRKERKPKKRRRLANDYTHVLDQGVRDFPDTLHKEVMNRCRFYG